MLSNFFSSFIERNIRVFIHTITIHDLISLFMNLIPLFIGLIFWACFGHAGYLFHSRSLTKSHDLCHASSLSMCELRPPTLLSSCKLNLWTLFVVFSLHVLPISTWWVLVGSRVNYPNYIWVSNWWSSEYNNTLFAT